MTSSVYEIINKETDKYSNTVNIKKIISSLTKIGIKVVKENTDMCENRMVLYNTRKQNNSKSYDNVYRECNGMVITNHGEILVYPIPPIVNFNHLDMLEHSSFNVTPLYDGTIINMYYYMNTWRISTRRSYDCTKIYPDGIEMTYGGIVFGLLLTFRINLEDFNTDYSYSLCVSSKVLHPYAKTDRVSLIAAYKKSGEIVVENIPNLQYSPIKKYNYAELKEFIKNHLSNVGNKYFGSLISMDSDEFISTNTQKIYKLESDLFIKIQNTLYNPKLVTDLRNMGINNRPVYTMVYNALNNTVNNLIEIMPEWIKYYELLILVLMEVSGYINNKLLEENNCNTTVIVQENEKIEVNKIPKNDFVSNLLNVEFIEKFRIFCTDIIKFIYNTVEKNKQLPEIIRLYINTSSQLAFQLYELIFSIYNHINNSYNHINNSYNNINNASDEVNIRLAQ